MIDIDRIRSDLEAFTGEIDREYYLNYSGQKDNLEVSGIYRKFQHMFGRDVIDRVRDSTKTAEGEQNRRLSYLREFLVGEYLENQVKELTEKSLTLETQATIEVGGEKLPFRQSAVTMANEPDRSKRKSIFEARNIVIGEINPILKERIQLMAKTSQTLGYPNYAELIEDVKGINLLALERNLKPFLEKTGEIYRSRMGDFVRRRLGIKLSDAEKHDMTYAFRAVEFDKYFRKEAAVQTLVNTLAALGIDLRRQKNIHLDVEERAKKTPRAFIAPIKVPDDIKLVVMPQGGHDDYATLFHEAGHAQHLGSTRSDLPMEYRYLGDRAVTEGFAFLMEYLVTNGQWLTNHTSMKNPQEFLEFFLLYKLYFLRRYSAKLSYEIELHKNGLGDAPQEYREKLESVLVFKHHPSHYLTDVDDGFYTATYLRAWIFEAQLRRILVQHFGENWFEKKGAGVQLQKWWSLGQKYRADEMLKDLGYQGLDLTPLLEEITAALR